MTALLRADGGDPWFEYALGRRWTRSLLRRIERLVLPGVIVHFSARKRWIEQAVVTALGQGCKQVVVIGAGLDTLAWRLHRRRNDVTFWELDHPASQIPKLRALPELGCAANLALRPVDLQAQLPSAVLLPDDRFDRTARTCFVAEGLLMYLPESRVRAVLGDMAQLSRVEIVCTFMEPDATGQAAFRGGSRLIEYWLRSRSEPMAWAIAREQLAEFVSPLGLQVRTLVAEAELRATLPDFGALASTPLAAGECEAILFRELESVYVGQ